MIEKLFIDRAHEFNGVRAQGDQKSRRRQSEVIPCQQKVQRSQHHHNHALHALSKAKQYALTHHLPTWAMQYLDNSPSAAPTLPPLLDPLTPREQEILHLMAKGLSSPKIAHTLIVGVSTVRSHIKHIYSKLDTHSRHEAISKAKELGLV